MTHLTFSPTVSRPRFKAFPHSTEAWAYSLPFSLSSTILLVAHFSRTTPQTNAPYSKPFQTSFDSYKTFLQTQLQAQHHVILSTIQILKPLHYIALSYARPTVISNDLLTTNMLISRPTSTTLQFFLFDTLFHHFMDSR